MNISLMRFLKNKFFASDISNLMLEFSPFVTTISRRSFEMNLFDLRLTNIPVLIINVMPGDDHCPKHDIFPSQDISSWLSCFCGKVFLTLQSVMPSALLPVTRRRCQDVSDQPIRLNICLVLKMWFRPKLVKFDF